MSGSQIIGRGNRDGADLFRGWFAGLTDTAEAGDNAAYVFVMGSLCELLVSMDFPIVFPEIHSLQTAVRRSALPLLEAAEDHGYSPDICGYVKADIAIQLQGGKHPMGRIPPPSIAIATNACNTYIKWAEAWQRLYGIPIFTLDIPGTREAGAQSWPGSDDFLRDRLYVEAQVRELIALCEEVAGKKLDLDRLREAMRHANTVSACWRQVLELNRSRPSLYNALTDGTIFLGVANALRGTPEAAAYFTDLVEEMEEKASLGIGTLSEEKWRLAFVGVPCYPIFRRFNELFSEWGGTFVASTYLWFASGGSNRGFQYELAHPVASLAEGLLLSVRDAMDSMFHHDRILPPMVEEFALDGVVYHPIKSCRTTSTGLADGRRVLTGQGISSLFIESDMMDKRVVSEAQLKNRVDAFFEGLASKRDQLVAQGRGG